MSAQQRTYGNARFYQKKPGRPHKGWAATVLGYKKKPGLGAANFLERLIGNFQGLWEKFASESYFESFEEYKNFGRKINDDFHKVQQFSGNR